MNPAFLSIIFLFAFVLLWLPFVIFRKIYKIQTRYLSDLRKSIKGE